MGNYYTHDTTLILFFLFACDIIFVKTFIVKTNNNSKNPLLFEKTVA